MRPSTSGSGRYGGLELPDAGRLKALEDANAKLKKLAEAMLGNSVLKDVTSKSGDVRR